VIFYGSKIHEQKSPIQKAEAFSAMFPARYPAEAHPIYLAMDCSHEDDTDEFWNVESKHLEKQYNMQIGPFITNARDAHFSLFALAPQPLLIKLGTLFTDKTPMDTYQLMREPKTWKWQDRPENFKFTVHKPENYQHNPVLIISISDYVDEERITSVIGNDASIWRITVPEEHLHNDCIRHPSQLVDFRRTLRKLMGLIKKHHGNETLLRIFPCMPVSCAIEMGRIRMPKADMPWHIFDQNNKQRKFIKLIRLPSFLNIGKSRKTYWRKS